MQERSYIKIGVAGPVGSGKTALIERLSRQMANDYNIGVVTNDIYTKEDAEYLTKNSLLASDKIIFSSCSPKYVRQKIVASIRGIDAMQPELGVL